jgi:hypothetical protein
MTGALMAGSALLDTVLDRTVVVGHTTLGFGSHRLH